MHDTAQKFGRKFFATYLKNAQGLTIVEIGSRVGYGAQSHFTKVFREATGLTPRAFREAARRIEG